MVFVIAGMGGGLEAHRRLPDRVQELACGLVALVGPRAQRAGDQGVERRERRIVLHSVDRSLAALADAGKAVVVACDHGMFDGPHTGMEDIPAMLERVGDGPDAILLSPALDGRDLAADQTEVDRNEHRPGEQGGWPAMARPALQHHALARLDVAALLDGNTGAPLELNCLHRCLTVRKEGRATLPRVSPKPAGRDGSILGPADARGKQYLGNRP